MVAGIKSSRANVFYPDAVKHSYSLGFEFLVKLELIIRRMKKLTLDLILYLHSTKI